MAILSTNQRLIKVDVDYSAGNGIAITSGVISVTGDNAPYSAGQNIYFDGEDNHIINGKDWANDIEQASANAYNVTTAWVQDNYANSADMTYISAMVDTKLDTSAWSSVSGDFATESYVIMADNITYDRAKGYVDSKGYATEEFVNENTSGKLDSTAFTNWQNGQYANDLQTIEGQIANKVDLSSWSSISSDFNSLSSNVNSNSGTWNDVVNKLYISSYHELTAGDNIDIQNYIISSKDWTNEIAQASAYAYSESTAQIPTLTFHYLEI